jgi:hypothetical protein
MVRRLKLRVRLGAVMTVSSEMLIEWVDRRFSETKQQISGPAILPT